MWIIIAIYIHIVMVINMRTIQMTLDKDLVLEVDAVVKKLKTNRSSFTREALKAAVTEFYVKELEAKQIAGYQKNPVEADEFSDFEDEQTWGD